MLIKRKKLAGEKKTLAHEHGHSLGLEKSAPGQKLTQAMQLELHKAKQEAKAIKDEAEKVLEGSREKLREAEEFAENLIKEAEESANNIKQSAYNEALAVAQEESEALKEHAKELFKEVFNVKRNALMQAHKEIMKIALDLAEKIIRYQVSIDPEILKTQVVESIKKATSEAERVQVFVNPQDLAKLEQSINEIEKLFPAGIDIIPLANEAVDIGSCMIETKSGQLDARFSTQLMTLLKLSEHLEIADPVININEEVVLPERKEIVSFEELDEKEETANFKQNFKEHEKELFEEGLLTEEEKEVLVEEENLTQELLSEENIDLNLLEEIQEEPVEFKASYQEVEEPLHELEQDINKQEAELLEIPEIEQRNVSDIEIEDELDLDEDREESEQGIEYLFEEEDDEEGDDDEEVSIKDVLKPKKKSHSQDVDNLAQEIEENPEWKNLKDED